MRETREALEAVQAGRRPLGGSGPASPVPIAARMAAGFQEPSKPRKPVKAPRSKAPLIAAGVAVALLLGVGAWVVPGMLSNGSEEEVAAAGAPKKVAAASITPAGKTEFEPATPAAAAAAGLDRDQLPPEPAANPTGDSSSTGAGCNGSPTCRSCGSSYRRSSCGGGC